MVYITAYLDGQTVGIGYKYIVTRSATAWRAFRTDDGLRYFLKNFGLTIDPTRTELHDCRSIGRGRWITMVCKEKTVCDDYNYFYTLAEVPKEAKPYYDIVNAEYVTCYILDTGDKVTTYKPNPNAKNVYKPLDYHAMTKLIG